MYHVLHTFAKRSGAGNVVLGRRCAIAGRPSAWPDGPRVDIVVIYHRAS